ncbi:MAG: PDDEXK family nuclease [Syntrophales bacterium]
MENWTTKYPFELPYSEVQADLDTYVDAVFSCLESEFLVMPKGIGFIDYPVFEQGYEVLKHATGGFTFLDCKVLLQKTFEVPVVILVLRTMLGFTPPEWAYMATLQTGVEVSQGFVRTLDRKIRLSPLSSLGEGKVTVKRVKALIDTACRLLQEGAPEVSSDKLHRLDKADTKTGMNGVQTLAGMGAPYAMLLYERFLGRPFAGHRDSVSDLVGDSLESAIEDALSKAGVSYRKTKRAEKIPGFDQTPDFIIPSEFNPQIIIEAKITEDDGTARDKATRIQHLGELSMAGQPPDRPKYEVIACIAGRGFGVRREDMKKILTATRGKVFTLRNLDRLIDCTKLKEYKTK